MTIIHQAVITKNSMVTHPVIVGYQLSVQSEIIRISHMQFALLPLFQHEQDTPALF